MVAEPAVIFGAAEIGARVAEIAAEIRKEFKGRRLLCLVVLKGGFFFAADLIRALQGVQVELEFVKLQSYAGTRSLGTVEFNGRIPKVSGYDVLVIEDLVDTGLTLNALHEALVAQGPRSVRYAVVVDKKPKRQVEFECEYVAFDIVEDIFLIGYGMDYEGKYRTLPDIRKL